MYFFVCTVRVGERSEFFGDLCIGWRRIRLYFSACDRIFFNWVYHSMANHLVIFIVAVSQQICGEIKVLIFMFLVNISGSWGFG